MANAVIEIPNLPSGQTLTADLVNLTSDAAVESAAALTERTNAKTRYRWTHTGEATGWHAVVVKLGSSVLGGFVVNLANADGVYYAGDAQAVNWAAVLNADEEVDLPGTTVSGLSAAGVKAIWDQAASALTTAGSIGRLLVDNLVGAASVAAAVWSYAQRTITMPAAAVLNALRGNRRIALIRGATFTFPLHGLGSIADREALWFTVKEDLDDDDDEAIVQIDLTGLLVIEAAAGTAAYGEITVNDEDTGSVDIVLHAEASQGLELREDDVYWDLKIRRVGGSPEERHVIAEGKGTVAGTATRSI